MTASEPLIHPTAIIDEGAQIGADTRVWQWVHIMPGARIGRGGSIGQGCYIGNVTIGDGCRIQNHVSVYDGVTLADDVFLGPACVFTNVKNPRADVSRKDAYAPTSVGRGASIGANATILCGISIGEYALIGAGAVVTANVRSHSIVIGTPAVHTSWACRCGETLGTNRTCARCGDRYSSDGDTLRRLTDDSDA